MENFAKRTEIIKPTDGKRFEVNPLSIDQTLFQEKRKDEEQEKTRQIILNAFVAMKKYPEKYGKKFYTMMPEKSVRCFWTSDFDEWACALGDHIADCIEQSLEWAQRIANGESWEDLCNKGDTANWYRLIKCRNGIYRWVGGSTCDGDGSPATFIYPGYYDNGIHMTVPLVVSYDE